MAMLSKTILKQALHPSALDDKRVRGSPRVTQSISLTNTNSTPEQHQNAWSLALPDIPERCPTVISRHQNQKLLTSSLWRCFPLSLRLTASETYSGVFSQQFIETHVEYYHPELTPNPVLQGLIVVSRCLSALCCNFIP